MKKISLEPKFKYSKGLFGLFHIRKKVVVQGDTFKFGFKVTNIDKYPVSDFRIKDIKIRPASQEGMMHTFKKEYKVDLLNPGDSEVFWISDFGTDMCGLTMIELNIVSPEEGGIEAYQINRFNSEEEKHFNNKWLDFIYVKSSHEQVQEETNNLILFATTIAVIIAYMNFLWPNLFS